MEGGQELPSGGRAAGCSPGVIRRTCPAVVRNRGRRASDILFGQTKSKPSRSCLSPAGAAGGAYSAALPWRKNRPRALPTTPRCMWRRRNHKVESDDAPAVRTLRLLFLRRIFFLRRLRRCHCRHPLLLLLVTITSQKFIASTHRPHATPTSFRASLVFVWLRPRTWAVRMRAANGARSHQCCSSPLFGWRASSDHMRHWGRRACRLSHILAGQFACGRPH